MPQKGFCLELKCIPLVTSNCLFRICVFILVFSCAHILKASAIVLTVLSGAPLRASGVQVGHLQTHTGLPACQEIPEMFASDTSAVSAQETCLNSVGFTMHKQTIHTVGLAYLCMSGKRLTYCTVDLCSCSCHLPEITIYPKTSGS